MSESYTDINFLLLSKSCRPLRLRPKYQNGTYLVEHFVGFKLCTFIIFDTTHIFRDISEIPLKVMFRNLPLFELKPNLQDF